MLRPSTMLDSRTRRRGTSRLPDYRKRAAALAASTLLIAWAASAAPPDPSTPSSAPAPALDTVTIQTQRDRAILEQRVEKFVSGITRTPFQDSLARWQKEVPICFAIAGFTREHGEYTLSRLSQIASAAGAPLAPDHCKPNFRVVATAVPDDMMTLLRQQSPAIFGDATDRKIRQFTEATTPIRTWYNVTLFNSDGSGCGIVVNGADSVPICQGNKPTSWGAVRDLTSVLVLIDTRRTKDINWDQLVAFVAMTGLAEIRLNANPADAPTILRLFTDSANAPVQGMTLWDTAYLKALYGTDHSARTQVLAMGQSIVKDIAP